MKANNIHETMPKHFIGKFIRNTGKSLIGGIKRTHEFQTAGKLISAPFKAFETMTGQDQNPELSDNEKIGFIIQNQAYRPPDDRRQTIFGFIYHRSLSDEDIAIYLNENDELWIGIRGTSTFADVRSDLQLINHTSVSRFNKNMPVIQQAIEELNPVEIYIVAHSLAGFVALKAGNQIPQIDFIMAINPAINLENIGSSFFNGDLRRKTVIFRRRGDPVSIGNALSLFKTKTLPLTSGNLIKNHTLGTFLELLEE